MPRLYRVSIDEAQRSLVGRYSGAVRVFGIPDRILHDAINSLLSDKQQLYARRYYFDNKTMTEIADEFNVNKSTVSRTLTRAKVKLKKALKYALLK